jgi:excisionase family DNA binding protein
MVKRPTTRYLRTAEAAAALRTSTDTVRRWIREGRVPARRVSPKGPLLINPADLEQALRAAGPQEVTT